MGRCEQFSKDISSISFPALFFPFINTSVYNDLKTFSSRGIFTGEAEELNAINVLKMNGSL